MTIAHVEDPTFGGPRTVTVRSTWFGEDSRLDAGHYDEGTYALEEALNTSGLRIDRLVDLCGTMWHPVQKQARSNFKRIYTRPEHGVPFLSSRSMFSLPLKTERYLSRLMPKLPDLMVQEGWIVVSRSGTLGNVLYVNDALAQAALSDHAIRVEPTGALSGYVYAYLRSPLGQAQVSKGGYGSTVEELEPKHLGEVLVARLGDVIEQAVHDLVVTAARLRSESNERFAQAEDALLRACDLSLFAEDDVEYLSAPPPKTFAVSSGELENRLDASHHLPIVRSVVGKLGRSRVKLMSLGQTSARVSRPNRFKRVYVDSEHGLPFFQPSYVPLYQPQQYKYLSRKANEDVLEECVLKPDTILVTRSGSAAKACLVTEAFSGWIGSDDLIRIVPGEEWDAGFLAAFVMTDYARHQMLAEVYGGVIDHINEPHVKGILVPMPDPSDQKVVGDLLRSAYAARDEAAELDDQAVTLLMSHVTAKISTSSE